MQKSADDARIIKPGVTYMPIKEYHNSNAVGSHDLKLILEKSPMHYKAAKAAPEKSSKWLNFGTAFHSAMSESYDDDVMVLDVDGRTKSGKEQIALAKETGKIVITKWEDFDIGSMRQSILSHPFARKLVMNDDALKEASYFWVDVDTIELCKCRPDLWIKDKQIVVDYKTTLDASPGAVQSAIQRYSYDLQAAYYSDALAAQMFFWIFVEKTPPYAVGVYLVSEETLMLGREKYTRALEIYHRCKTDNNWPGYSQEFIEV